MNVAKSVWPYVGREFDSTELKESIGLNNFSKYKYTNGAQRIIWFQIWI